MVYARFFMYFAVFFITHSAFGYIYEIRVLKKWNSEIGQYQYVIGLSDYHDKKNQANIIQRAHIQQAFAHAPKNKIQLIVEDLSSSNKEGNQGCGTYVIASQEGILAGLAQFTRNLGIKTENVEYRYCRVASLGPVVLQPEKNPQQFPVARSMRVGTLLDELHTNITLPQNNRNAKVNTLCTSEHAAVQVALKKLNLTAYKDSSIADYLSTIRNEQERLARVKELLIFDSALLDIKIVHAIMQSSVPVIVVCAGGSHIARTSCMLEKIGYSLAAKTSPRYYKEYDLSKCRAATISHGACTKPYPVSLNVFDQYLPR